MKRLLIRSLLAVVFVLAVLTVTTGVMWWRTRPEEPTLQRHALRRDVLGCYALFGADGQRVDTTYYNASPIVRLDSISVRGSGDSVMWGNVEALDTLGRPSRTTRGMSGPSWSADSLSDTIRVSFVNGFSGAEFVLNAPVGGGNTLRGRAAEHWDFGPRTTRRGAAHAQRIDCPRDGAKSRAG